MEPRQTAFIMSKLSATNERIKNSTNFVIKTTKEIVTFSMQSLLQKLTLISLVNGRKMILEILNKYQF